MGSPVKGAAMSQGKVMINLASIAGSKLPIRYFLEMLHSQGKAPCKYVWGLPGGQYLHIALHDSLLFAKEMPGSSFSGRVID